MHYRTLAGVNVTIPSTRSNLGIYQACRSAGLLRNETHSALDYDADETGVTVYRLRDGSPILELERVDRDA